VTEEPKDIKKKIVIHTIDEVENAPDLEPLWGNWIFRNSVILQAGEPGISKTTFNYAFTKAVVDDLPFLGVEPTEADLCVFIIDFESSEALMKSRMRSMGGMPKNTHRFRYYNDPENTIFDLIDAVKEQKVEPDIIIVDPIRYAFNMRDENDNAEASKQAKYLRQVATDLHCAIIIVHHSAKNEATGWKKASGASSRTALADICMNFDGLGDNVKGEPIYPDMFKLTIPKNRMMDDHFKLFIRKEDKTFTVCDPPKGYTEGEYDPATARYTVQQMVKGILNLHVAKSPVQILAELGNCCTRQALYKALGHLISLGEADHNGYGEYLRTNQHK